MTMKHLVVGLALLALAGCGCGDDGGDIPPNTEALSPAWLLNMDVPPCEFRCEETPEECRIDVVFVLDDSEFMNRANGMASGRPLQADPRSRTLVSQEVFRQTRARLLGKIQGARMPAGPIPANVPVDLAFAVVRYEDFGGTVVDYQQNAGTIDATARPHMLQMPLLRELHPEFTTRFEDALTAQTHGNGNPQLGATPQNPFNLPFQDPQSAVESLFQIATGLGLDGDGDGTTTGNGFPGSLTAQNRIADSANNPNAATPYVDVPRTAYVQNGQDPQDPNRPIYNVVSADNAGTPGPGTAGVISSGNQGGVGFRPNSIRFVIFASDIATVAPFRNNQNTPANPADDVAVQNPLLDANASSVEASGASVPASAFNGVTGRFGGPGLMPNPAVGAAIIAPANAADVENTMNQLVSANIEVMALGALGVQPGQTKPNVSPEPDPNRVPAILAPANPDFTPFTMESAISILTGSRITDGVNPGNLFPAVFNMGNVGVLNNASPNQTQVTDDVVDGLVERIAARINQKEPGTVQNCVLLPELTMNLTIQLNEGQADGTTNYLRQNGPQQFSVQVTIPSYYLDPVTMQAFTVDAGGNRTNLPGIPATQTVTLVNGTQYILRNPDLVDQPAPLPIDPLSFTVTAAEVNIANQTGQNTAFVAQLRQKISSFFAGGQLTVQARKTTDPGAQRGVVFQPGSNTGRCLTFQDITPPAPFAVEHWGPNCPAPANP